MIVPISLGSRSYHITVGSNSLHDVGAQLSSFQPSSSAVVLTDVNVQHYGYADRVAASIADAGISVHVLSVQAGEQSKTIETANTLWEMLLENGTDRKSVLVAVGGGVVGDLGGFVAATYARGIRFFQVPTTLLAQVDSSVGGKVGIDLTAAKNMVGAFHQPLGVLIDTETLHTLPEEEYLSGLGEVLKYGVSLDASLFEYIEANIDPIKNRDNAVLQTIVAECCRIKAQIVAEDEYETTGRRILLNYGHTFAHAFEIASGYKILHGLAVSMGMICAAQLALRLSLVDEAFLQRQLALHRALNLPVEYPAGFDQEQIIELMRRDKKSEFGRLRFVLPTGLGQCRVVEGIESEQVFSE
ncbi:MAG: 3-dehydroquinate synthase [Planctomycetaceae bacterium]|nr:3-dehydroquinate synthase [Planctomycetaceae bacterium]